MWYGGEDDADKKEPITALENRFESSCSVTESPDSSERANSVVRNLSELEESSISLHSQGGTAPRALQTSILFSFADPKPREISSDPKLVKKGQQRLKRSSSREALQKTQPGEAFGRKDVDRDPRQVARQDSALSTRAKDSLETLLGKQSPTAQLEAVKLVLGFLNRNCCTGISCFPPGVQADGETTCLGKFTLLEIECDSTALHTPAQYLKRVRTKGKGWGVVASQALDAQQVLCEYIGKRVSVSSFEKWDPQDPRFDYALEVKSNKVILNPLVRDSATGSWTLPTHNLAPHINHACGALANAAFIEGPGVKNRSTVWVVTLRAVRKGEELTVDYGWVPDPCLCAACSRKPQ
jgi:hypothetical protein